MSDQLDRIEQKLDLILETIQKPTQSRGIATTGDGELDLPPIELRRARVAEMERIFIHIVNLAQYGDAERYKLPQYLKTHPLSPAVEAVPVATVANQASLRKIFRLRAPSDPVNSTPMDRAKAALEDSNLITVVAKQTQYITNVSTALAMSPAEVVVSASSDDTPEEFVGWTTSDRVVGRPSEVEGQDRIEPHTDPSGERNWDTVDETETEKKPRKVKFGG